MAKPKVHVHVLYFPKYVYVYILGVHIICSSTIFSTVGVEHCTALKQKVTEEPFLVITCSPNPEARGPELGRNNTHQQVLVYANSKIVV